MVLAAVVLCAPSYFTAARHVPDELSTWSPLVTREHVSTTDADYLPDNEHYVWNPVQVCHGVACVVWSLVQCVHALWEACDVVSDPILNWEHIMLSQCQCTLKSLMAVRKVNTRHLQEKGQSSIVHFDLKLRSLGLWENRIVPVRNQRLQCS